MFKRLTTIAALLAASTLSVPAQDGGGRPERLQEHVSYLASDAMMGRKAGTDDAAAARKYIIDELSAAGVVPLFEEGWEMPFTKNGTGFCNVVGVIRGADPVMAREYIVIGAHYDHLGVKNGEIYNGADDNASGTAAIIEMARDLVASGLPGRSVIVAAFDAEELGLYGSTALCDKLREMGELGSVKLMLSVDMVGWYSTSGFLKMEGYGTVIDGKEMLEAEAAKAGLNLKLKKFETSVFTATDTQAFAMAGIPTLDVTTGLKSPYHKPQDDPELIDYKGLDSIVGFLDGLAGDISGQEYFVSSGKVAAKHSETLRMFEFGLRAGAGDTNLDFKEGAVTAHSMFSWNAGITAQFNIQTLGIRADLLYERMASEYPVAADLYGSGARFSQNALCVPVVLLAQDKEGPVVTYAGVGAYYRRVLSTSCGETLPAELRPDQWGWQLSFGARFGRLDLGFDGRYPVRSVFAGGGAPDVRLSTASFTVSYYF